MTQKKNNYGPIMTTIPARNEATREKQYLVDDYEVDGLYYKRRACFIADGQAKRTHDKSQIGKKQDDEKRILKMLKKKVEHEPRHVFKFEELQEELKKRKGAKV